ncbi:pirin family protein [Pontibacterium sp. N1Y112]|uniref:Pirin family protein n=1 Tax=Pontibacterium sinense TaxID=2781979 RepID=A0A8J7FD09_9GAMM|nr:pirin family protein [Pontibacterium sinense]MBE9397464.1 pirin family protein [Pontibacterium sinense]
MTTRTIQQIIPAIDTSDGAGVQLKRSVGQRQSVRVDPFLMLDAFNSDNADDYIAGFPAHPHRGFETVTYMLNGSMIHRDHMGNEGELNPGGVQWMTAGRGVIHEERPQRSEGLMRGFQLWVNLPASEKMKPAHYQNIEPEQVPDVQLSSGGRVRVIAGQLALEDHTVTGPVTGVVAEPMYLDVRLQAGEVFSHSVPESHNLFIYPYEGTLTVDGRSISTDQAVILHNGDQVKVTAGQSGTSFLLLAGKPINEPIAQYGPFVMNTMEEIDQALEDYREGRLTD